MDEASLLPNLLVRYDAKHDEIRVLDLVLDSVREPSGDIGEDGARARAHQVLDDLVRRHLVDGRLYRNSAVDVGYKRVGAGTKAGTVTLDRIAEYRVTLRSRLDGIEVANAGVRVGVLATGEIVSVRFGGMTPKIAAHDGTLQPTGVGGSRETRVGAQVLLQRFQVDVPSDAEAEIASSRLMYIMPEDMKAAVVEPAFVVSYTERRTVEGESVRSRRKTLVYSILDPRAAPVDLAASKARHQETTPTQQER
jgi:hypothetical protein